MQKETARGRPILSRDSLDSPIQFTVGVRAVPHPIRSSAMHACVMMVLVKSVVFMLCCC